MTKDTEALREAVVGNTAIEKIAILSNKDWPLARVDTDATLDMIHEIAVEAIYPTAPTALATPASDVAPVGDDERMVTVASRNLKTFIKAAQFKCGADRDAALACIGVLDDRISGLNDLVAVLRSAFAASQSLAQSVDPVAGGEALREALEWYRDQLCEGFCEGFTPRICKAAMEENPTGGDCSGCRAVIALAALKGPAA